MIRNPRKKEVLIALGANLPSAVGAPEHTLAAALNRLQDAGVSELEISKFYRTPCFPAGAGPEYVNAAAAFAFEGTATSLLAQLHEIEAEFGRTREQRWGQRSLDLDLIVLGDEVLPDVATYTAWKDLAPEAQRARAPSELILPHPRLQDRAFVLVPLLDVAPDWRHPVLGLSVREMAERIDPALLQEVVPI